MTKRLWILTVGALASSAPVKAQPVALEPEPQAGAASLSARELEDKIGGRTTLELKFQDLTAQEASAALAKASGLRFGAAQDSPWNRVVSTGTTGSGQADGPRYNAEVGKTDFWLGVRAWSRAEAARMKREREALQRRQNEEKPPPAPTAPQGQEVAPEAMKAWQAEQNEWMRRRSQQMQRFSANVSVRFDPNAQLWSLSPGDQIATGRALSAWPCLVLATGFQRSQNLSIEESEAGEKPQPNAPGKAGDQAALMAARAWDGAEAVEGGQLRDSLSLGLSVYLEPKLMDRAKVQLQVSEARDEQGEDLLPEREKGAMGQAQMQMQMGSQLFGGQGNATATQVSLRPRQARGKKLAILRGVVLIRYPMQLQEHEITDFNGPQGFALGTGDLPAQAQFQPPRIENGQFVFGTSLTLISEKGGRATWDNSRDRIRRRGVEEGALGQYLLPSLYTFTDSQGRTWRGSSKPRRSTLKGPDGSIVPQTSPPTPPPDNFTYTEERTGTLQLVPEVLPPATPGVPPRLTITPSILARTGTATYISQVPVGNSFGGFRQPVQLSPEELAKVRFTKATFTTESDWRTLEFPFEFRDLPLPPR